MRPASIGLIGHTGKPGVAELVQTLSAEFARVQLPVMVEEKTAAIAGMKSGYSVKDLGRLADLLVVLGGDGTILSVVGRLGETIKPIFGINVGSLGFLTCVNSSAYAKAVECIAAGKMIFSQRTLLEVRMKGAGSRSPILIGLNDAVFSRGEVSRLIRLRVYVNGEVLTEFNADGLIVATPTGSTAYSLSAGGPILAPESGAFVITPICPHVLTNRSIIVDETALIEVEVTEKDYPVFLTVDGGEPLRVESERVIEFKKSERTLPLASLPGVSFFGVVRQKLKWSGSNI